MFKLLREVRANEKITDVKVTKAIQEALGMKSTADVVELLEMDHSYIPDKHDYEMWMSTIQDLAREDGAVVTTKQQLASYAFTVLDDDPKVDAMTSDKEASKRAIINTLWAAFQAAKHHANTQRRFAKSPRPPEENEELHVTGTRDVLGDDEIADHFSSNVDPDHPMPHDGESYEDHQDRTTNHDDVDSTDSEETLDDDDVDSTDSEETLDDDGDDTTFDLSKLIHAVIGDEDVFKIKDKVQAQEKNGSSHSEDEEEVKTLFRKVVTSPKELLSQAVKDIEEEGAKAVRDLEMPRNPHPRGTSAHKAWAKGMKNEAKRVFGIVDNKPTPMQKNKRK